jgi:hypothetical protein
MSIFHRIAIVFHIVIEGRISTIYHLICIESSERKLILDNTAFSYYISVETVEVQSFLKLGSLQVLPWNLRQLISYFFALIIYLINLLKTARKTFATGNAIYPLPRTIIKITNDNSIFRKEGIHVKRLH